MVRNIKIKHFLIISFIAILALTVVLGLFALTFTQKLASETQLFYEHPHTVELEVAQVRLDMANIGSEIRGAMVVQTPERTQKTTDFIATTMADITERVAIVKKQFTGDQQILLDTDAIVVEWVAAIEKIRPLMEQQKYDEAITVFQTEYQPQEQRLSASCDNISDHSSSISKSVYDDAVETQVMARVVTFSLLIFNILLTIIICSIILKSITVPLKKVKEAAEAMASGNLHQNVDFSGKNEFGLLAQSMNKTTCTLAAYVDNIDTTLSKMSDNDMTVTVDMDYIGDFAPIKASLQRIIDSLNHTLEQIEASTEQVASSAQQMSYSAQTLSQGAAEQAASVEELSANISEISAQVQQNAGTTGEMLHLVNFVGTELERGNGQMGQMLGAINEINTASDQIAKIIKTIEDIAFQTNILALNASVEAARAGTAGKGFAVVADEVRSLAGKSSDAAKNTTTLISNSIQAVQNGTKIAHDTATTLKSVVDGAQKITDMVTQISESSDQQAGALTQITGAVAQISQVIQTNSATSEESAAASQELNGQANVLEESVRRFQLRRTGWQQTSTSLNSPAIRRK